VADESSTVMGLGDETLAMRLVWGAAIFTGCCTVGVLSMALIDASRAMPTSTWKGFMVSVLPALVAAALVAWRVPLVREIERGLDPVTGLLNVTRLLEALPLEISRAQRFGKHVGLVIVDLEQPERAGVPQEVAWRATARMLRRCLRLTDACFVLEPGRFALLLSATNPEGGPTVVERLRKAAHEVPELYGVKLRFGHEVFEPGDGKIQDASPLLARVVEKARAAMVETTVPKLPLSAVVKD
jgi:GGDEF domain-containing protein